MAMIENILNEQHFTRKGKLGIKLLVSCGLIILALVLPQTAHLIAGERAGALLLPMYLPVLLGGCLLGARWGAALGISAPVVSFLITSSIGSSAMPSAERLPFMMLELAIFATVSGVFSSLIRRNSLWSVPAVISAELCGRAVFAASVILLGNSSPLSITSVTAQLRMGVMGMILNAVVVPAVVIAFSRIADRMMHCD